MDMVTLNNGAKMPLLGLGTWKARPGEVGNAVEYALTEAGYRHIDCAWIYRNEPQVGEAFERVFRGGIRRSDVFVTSKLWNSFHAPRDVANACKESLRDLKLDYLDLYLMHWGIADAGHDEPLDRHGVLAMRPISIRETWEAMEELVEEGLTKAIGVSNFTAPMLLDLLSYAKMAPAVNQIELHPYLQQERLVEFCRYKDIVVTAYSPLGHSSGSSSPLADPEVASIAHEHGKTPAQILLRWGIQRGTIVIPKSARPERIKENAGVFDFALAAEDTARIAALDRRMRYVEPYDWWKVPYFD